MEILILSGGYCGQHALTFCARAKRDAKAAKRFFRKVLKARHTQSPRVITVDKNAAYPKAIETLKGDETRLRSNTVAAKEILEQYY